MRSIFNTKDEHLMDESALEDRYQTHIKEKDLYHVENDLDEKHESSHVVSCYDLQAALSTPNGEVSSFYYKSKLSTLNFTIYNLKTKETVGDNGRIDSYS